jgi:tripartite-type tricarboxylate transporter receptor subunit TctC
LRIERAAGVIGRYFSKRAGVSLVEVPYRSTAQAMQDTVAGRTNFYIGSAAAADALVKADRLRLFGVTSRNRFLGLEDIPAIAETLPGYRIEGWFAFVAPAGTPAEIVDRMKREINLSLQNPEMVQKLKGYGCAISRSQRILE